MNEEHDELGERLEKIAVMLARQITEGKSLDKDQVVAFSACSRHYISTRKLPKRGDGEKRSGFGRIKQRLAEVGGHANGADESEIDP